MRPTAAVMGLKPRVPAGKALMCSGTNSHCVPQCCILGRDCNWEQSQRWPRGLPTMLAGAGSAPSHLGAALSPRLVPRRAEQHLEFWAMGLQLGHPGKVTSRLGLVPARGSERQGWAWMWLEVEGTGAAQVLSTRSGSLLLL